MSERVWTKIEMTRIKFYYNKFVELYNKHRAEDDIDEIKFMRIMNVNVSSFQARWPNEKELHDEAVDRIVKAMAELREKDRAKKGIKGYGPRSSPPR